MAKILLVEDDNNLREIYEARLQAEGYDIVSARDGEEALVVAKSQQPDLIISDVMMPKISGFEMLDILRNTDSLKHVKVIMLTALGQAEDQTRADSLGADRYLVKSQVTLEDIVNVSQQLLAEAGAIAAPAAAAVEAPTPTPVTETTPITPEPVQVPAPTPAIAVEEVEEPVLPPAADLPVSTPVIPLAAAPPAVDDDLTDTPAPSAPEVTVPEAPAVETPQEPVEEPELEPQVTTPEPSEVPVPAQPEPVAVTEPQSSDQAVSASPAPEPIADTPETSAQEEADVEAQITEFIETQSSTPPAVVEPAQAPAEPMQPEVTKPETPPEIAVTATDEQRQKALNDAITSLGSQTAQATETPPAPIAPADGTAVHTKVITPLSGNKLGKKSFDMLVAEENARENAGLPGTVVTPAPAPSPAPQVMQDVTPPTQAPTAPVQPAPAPAPDEFDPNSIAL